MLARLLGRTRVSAAPQTEAPASDEVLDEVALMHDEAGGVGFWGWSATIVGVVCVLAVCAVSASMNWRFGYSLGRSEFDAQLYGAASVAADGLKALLPFFILAAWRNKLWSWVVGASFIWVVVMAYALTGAIGHAILNRSDSAQVRTVSADAYKALQESRKKLNEQLSWIPQHRPAETVQGEIEAQKVQRNWSATDGCKGEIKGAGNRTFCQNFARLNAELGSARQAGKLSEQIGTVDGKLSAFAGKAPAEGDPQVTLLSNLTNLAGPTVAAGLVLLLVLMLEAVSSLGLRVVTIAHQKKARPLSKMQRRIHAAKAAAAVHTTVGVPIPPDIGEPANDVGTTDAGPSQEAESAVTPLINGAARPAVPLVKYETSSPQEGKALRDLLGLIDQNHSIPSQVDLTKRWNVSEATVSRWLTLWEAKGYITRRSVARRVAGAGFRTNEIMRGAGAGATRAAA